MGVKILRKKTFFQKQQRDPIDDLARHLYQQDTYLTPWTKADPSLREAFRKKAEACAVILLGEPHIEQAWGVREGKRIFSGYGVQQYTVRGQESFSYTVKRYPRLTIIEEES